MPANVGVEPWSRRVDDVGAVDVVEVFAEVDVVGVADDVLGAVDDALVWVVGCDPCRVGPRVGTVPAKPNPARI